MDLGSLDTTAAAAGTYTISVTDAGGCTASTTVTIDQALSPILSASASATSFCSGSNVTLTGTSGFASYQWYNGSGAISGATSVTYTASSGGTYYVIGVSSSGCSVTSSSLDISEITLTAPTSLTASSVGVSTAVLSWDAVSPTGVYSVSYLSLIHISEPTRPY